MHTPRLNWLLANLPSGDYERPVPHPELVGLATGTQLFPKGATNTNFYFPTTCSISAQIELENGDTTDVYLMGEKACLVQAPHIEVRTSEQLYESRYLHTFCVCIVKSVPGAEKWWIASNGLTAEALEKASKKARKGPF
jgi:hypothetical protein